MLDRLGIAETRQGADGFNPQGPNAANYDEAKAGTPALPPLLAFADGRSVKTARDWGRRRAEIVALFDREVYGRVPDTAPAIGWLTIEERNAIKDGVPVVERTLIGVARNESWPQAQAGIRLR
jgi:hypothetical protein